MVAIDRVGPQAASLPVSEKLAKEHTQAGSLRSDVLAACAAAVNELKASRTLLDALDAENASLKSRLETEKRTTAILTELNETRKSETEALRKAIEAKTETIAARDTVIATQDKLIDALKTKKPSPWRRLGDILIGAAVIAVLK